MSMRFLNHYGIVFVLQLWQQVQNQYKHKSEFGQSPKKLILGHFPTSQISLGQIPNSILGNFPTFQISWGQIPTSILGHFPTSVLGQIPN